VKTLALLMLLAASPALAHAKLIASDPAANAQVKTARLIKLTFSETLEPAFSGADLSDAAGKTVPVSKSVGGAAITLLPLSLKPGAYKVSWHSVGHDTHRVSGSFGFKVVP
jgi:methionine-rich copper-binding protein CopC